jgi:hypothetical protein
MGTPEKVDVDGTPIFICCGACRQRLMDDPATYLARLGERRKAEAADADQPQADLPPAGPMKLLEPPAEGGGESDSEDRAASPRQAELPRETVR